MTPKKLRALMNNPADAPLYPYPPDYTNSETALAAEVKESITSGAKAHSQAGGTVMHA
jgi:hypothetical protein